MFNKKYFNENKIIDLSFLPLCKSTLLLHVKRANYLVKLWKICYDLDFTLPKIQNHGSLESGLIRWVKDVFAEDYCDWTRKRKCL